MLAGLGLAIDWRILGLFTAVGIAGSLIGSRVSEWIPQRALQRTFAAVLVLAGAGILASRWH